MKYEKYYYYDEPEDYYHDLWWKEDESDYVGLKDQSLETCLAAVRQDGMSLQYVDSQTEEICLEAVRQNGMALQYVKFQTPKICLAAVKQGGNALQYVKSQTPRICMAAIKKNELSLKYVREQTLDMCLLAVRQNGHCLSHVSDEYRTPEVIMEAVKRSFYVFKDVPYQYQTYDMCMLVVKKDGMLLGYVDPKLKDEKLCLEAVKQNPEVIIRYAYPQTPEIRMAAVKGNGLMLGHIDKEFHTEELVIEAIKNNNIASIHSDIRTDKVILEKLRGNGSYLSEIEADIITLEMCETAIDSFPDAIIWVPVDKFSESVVSDLYFRSISNDGFCIRHVPLEMFTPDLCIIAMFDIIKTRKKTEFRLYVKEDALEVEKQILSESLECLDTLGRIKKDGLRISDILEEDGGLHFILAFSDISLSEYWTILDYTMNNELELTDIQRKHLKLLGHL